MPRTHTHTHRDIRAAQMEVQWLLFQCPVHEPAAVLALVTGILENESDRLALEDVCLDSMYLWQAADRQVDPNHLHQGNYRQLGREHLHIAVGRAKARLWHTISIVAVPPATHLLPTFGLVLLHPAGPRAELRQWLRIYSPNWHLLGAAGILAEGQPLEDASQHKKILQYITAFFHRPRSERRLPTTPGWHPGSVPAARWLPDAALKQLSTQTWPASYPELLHDLHVWHCGGGTWAPVWATVPTSPLRDWFLKEAVHMVYEQNNLANRPSFPVLPMPMTQEADSPRYSLHSAASSTTAAVMISGIVLAEKDVQALLDSNMRKAVRANFGQEAEANENLGQHRWLHPLCRVALRVCEHISSVSRAPRDSRLRPEVALLALQNPTPLPWTGATSKHSTWRLGGSCA